MTLLYNMYKRIIIHSGLFSELRYMSNNLTFEMHNEIFRVVAKWLDNNGYKISWLSLENWLTGKRKANFHFGPSSTVGQTVYWLAVLLTGGGIPRESLPITAESPTSGSWLSRRSGFSGGIPKTPKSALTS